MSDNVTHPVHYTSGGIEAKDALKAAMDGSELSPICLLYTSPSPRDRQKSRMPSSA